MRSPASLTSASLAALLVACGASPKSLSNEGAPGPPAPSAPGPNGTTGAVAASAALPPDSILIGNAETVALPGALFAVEGRDLALAVVDFAEADGAWVRTVSPDGNLGAFHALPGAHIVRASGFEGAPKETFELLTTERDSLCTRTFDVTSDHLGPAKCLTAEADAVVATSNRWTFIDARPDPSEAPAATESIRRPPPQRKRPPKSGKKKRDEDARKAAEVTKAAVARLMDSGEKRLLFAAPWGEPFEPTDFEFREAMAGLSVVGASHRNGKITVLVTERASEAEKKTKKKNDKERLGRLTTLRLDDELKLIEGSEKHFGESPLDPGYLRDHASMGLTEIPGGAFALGRRGLRGKCDITLVDPYIMQLIADPEDCAVDLRRFLVTARARHDGHAPELGPDPDLDFASVKARWSDGASTYQRAVFGTTHAFSFSEKELFVWKVGEAVARFPSPFLTTRSPLLWGAHAHDGSSLTQVGRELFEILGTDVRRAPSPWPLESRSDLLRSLPTQAVKLGDTWWAARGTIAPIFPANPKVAVRGGHDDAILVEGAPDRPGSVVVSRVHGQLTVTPLSGEGVLGRPLTIARTVHGGLDAVRTAKGTVLVSSQRADHQVELTAISASLDRATEQPPIGARELRLIARPNGGAWAFDEARGQVLWLDDDGAVLAERAITPRSASPLTLCRDGRPAPQAIPQDAPGEMLDLPADVTCWVGHPAASPDGRYRVFSSLNGGSQATLRVFGGPGSERPSGAAIAASPSSAGRVTPVTHPSSPARCPSDMVLVMDKLCVDRFEGSLLGPGGLHLSPDYPATPGLLAAVLLDFGRGYSLYGPLASRAIPLPEIPSEELGPLLRGEALPLSVESRQNLLPSAFVTGHVAKEVCAARGKRLCKLEEWRTACRGEKNRKFPYGDAFDPGACNVAKDIHPGVVLHDNASVGHLDPRLNRVGAPNGGLLRKTGTTPRCKSEWGSDAIFDMVGNVDEWVDERSGAFAGGFYARPTRSGCESLVSAHPFGYLDYSTGVRCCADASSTPVTP